MTYQNLHPQSIDAEEARSRRIQEVLDALVKRANRPENISGQAYTNFHMRELDAFHLTEYLSDMKIDEQIAKEVSCEASFYVGHISKRAIAFENVAGGYALCEPRFRSYYGPKTISWERHKVMPDTCVVFEYFIDYLAFLTLIKQGDSLFEEKADYDAVVLNSIDPEQSSVIDLLNLYHKIECFHDNNEFGMKSFRSIRKLCLSRVKYTTKEFQENSIREYLDRHSNVDLRRRGGMRR